ncbi:serine-rich adhesin for platelets-like [Anastrepha ludens]|uniref:serine-rich adhesin for platelets-like n=1 Tax=Anastrepha ludens TaxID=28586 RepID=UPI0023B106CE|nr:serine-rich adhesin for platelets-like [Anastrepha ludens]
MSSHHRQHPQAISLCVNDTQNNVTEVEYKDQNEADDDDDEGETGHAALATAGQPTKTSTGTARGRREICDKPLTSDQQGTVKDNNNCQAVQQPSNIAADKQRFEKANSAIVIQTVNATPITPAGVNLKTSIYDWDSPSSFTGTVKRRCRRPHSVATAPANIERSLGHASVKQNAASESSALSVKASTSQKSEFDENRKNICNNNRNNNAISESNTASVDGRKLKRRTAYTTEAQNGQRPQRVALTTNIGSKNSVSNMPKSQRHGKEKSNKLRHSKSLASADRNANNAANTSSSPPSPHSDLGADHNSLTVSQHSHSSAPGTIPKSTAGTSLHGSYNRNLCNASFSRANELQNDPNAIRDANYMELSFYDGRYTDSEGTQFTELFRDFPVSYESTTVITNSQFAKCGLATQESPRPLPPYREPPPPTPPPISQMPTRDSRYLTADPCVTLSAPATPSRGKVVLSKKERKELSKLNARLGVYDGSEHVGGSTSAQSSPYKGRVSELKNCLARGLFASLSRGSHKSLTASSAVPDDATSSSNEISPPPPAPSDTSPPNSNASNNNDADYSDKLKNLPVRQRKTHVSHMDNYCLFDPVDFINEKAMRQRTHAQLGGMFEPATTHGLRDPLFSSRQNLNFSEEEIVPEVIYNEELPEEDDSTLVIEVTFEEACGGVATSSNFDHHNYFVIDPDDFEEEPVPDIGIPNPYTNEQLVHANLEALSVQTTTKANEPILRESASLEQLLEVLDAAPSMSNSQESKDTNTTASTTTTTSTALVESSTSTNSTSSSTSATSSQTTLQRTKKKLTFLNLSPFRTHSSKHSSAAGNSGSANDKRGKRHAGNDGNKTNNVDADAAAGVTASSSEQRAVSELVSSEHMLHLQHMLLDGKEHLRARTVPIESNYVLFNPGPVPSRNVPYKIRKPRPLSSHSDADSGFLSPCSPDELSALKFNSAILVLQQCDSVQGYIEVSGIELVI